MSGTCLINSLNNKENDMLCYFLGSLTAKAILAVDNLWTKVSPLIRNNDYSNHLNYLPLRRYILFKINYLRSKNAKREKKKKRSTPSNRKQVRSIKENTLFTGMHMQEPELSRTE